MSYILTPVVDAWTGFYVQSNEITINTIDPLFIAINEGEYSVNGSAWINRAGYVNNGDRIKVRHFSSNLPYTETKAILYLGTEVVEFSVTTGQVTITLSHEPGLYDKNFNLTINKPPEAIIRYKLNIARKPNWGEAFKPPYPDLSTASTYSSSISIRGILDYSTSKYVFGESILEYILLDNNGNRGEIQKVVYQVDPSLNIPKITSFILPETYESLTVPILEFTATDNINLVGYRITNSSTAPKYYEQGWTTVSPTPSLSVSGLTYTFPSYGTYTLYIWVKDNENIINDPVSATVTIVPPVITINEISQEINSDSKLLTGTCIDNGIISLSSNTLATFTEVTYNRAVTPNTWSCTVSNLIEGDNIITATVVY